jgi:hypothetical protein
MICRIGLIAGALFGLVALGVAAWHCFPYHKACPSLEALLAGDKAVRISTLVLRGQGKRFVLRDAVSLRYVSDVFRCASHEGYRPTHVGGLTYMAELSFEGGECVVVGIEVPDSGAGLTVAYPLDEGLHDPVHYWITFPDPIPEPLAKILQQLRGNRKDP